MEECSVVINSILWRMIVAIALRKVTLSNVEFRKLPVSGDFSCYFLLMVAKESRFKKSLCNKQV